jgi:hypothetical protein
MVVSDAEANDVESARQLAGLSVQDLWYTYIAYGGMASVVGLSRMLSGVEPMTRLEHDVIAQVINERFLELGGDHPVPYWLGS